MQIIMAPDGAAVCAQVKGRQSPGLCLQVRNSETKEVLWASAPLASLEVGLSGFTGRLGITPLSGAGSAPPGEVSFACDWRLQRSLPRVSKFRTRPLAMKYSAFNDREEFEQRLNLWRLELAENRATDLLGTQPDWTHPWLPPYQAHHFLGDPLTRRRQAEYKTSQAELADRLRAQAVSVQLEELRARLPRCQTAEQAVKVLENIRAFLDAPSNLPQINASQLLRQIKNLRLPFERLVRNVWQEGPEVQYDRSKASLTRLLQKEVAQRKALAAAAGPPPPPPPDTLEKTISPMIQEEMAMLKTARKHSTIGAPDSPASPGGASGVRVGLLTFYGSSPETTPQKRGEANVGGLPGGFS